MLREKKIRKAIPFFVVFFITANLFFCINNYSSINNSAGKFLFLKMHWYEPSIYVLSNNNEADGETFYLLGRIYFVKSKLNESIKSYNLAILKAPNVKEYYYGRGLAYGFSSPVFFINAEKDFIKYIEIEEEEFSKSKTRAYGVWAGYNDLAWIYFLMGNFSEMENAARKGLEISGSNPWLSNMLGVSLLAQKKCKESLLYLENADKLLKDISRDKFGEAYSGDAPDFWKNGKIQMSESIQENLALCKTLVRDGK